MQSGFDAGNSTIPDEKLCNSRGSILLFVIVDNGSPKTADMNPPRDIVHYVPFGRYIYSGYPKWSCILIKVQ